MSRTRGMSNDDRAQAYADAIRAGSTSGGLTPKQRRRLRHKEGHLKVRWSDRPKKQEK